MRIRLFTSRKFSYFAAFTLLLVVRSAAQSVTHPFLITKESDIPQLRSRAGLSPWREMKTQAEKLYRETRYDSGQNVSARGYQLRDITGAAALLYVLEGDSARQAAYKTAVIEAIGQWDGYLNDLKSGVDRAPNKWLFKVPPSSAFFNSVLALDVVYPHLTGSERQTAEARLAPVAEWFWQSTSSWDLADFGVRAIWAVFTQDRDRKETALRQYRQRLLGFFSPDGVYMGGTEYPHGRLGGERTAKFGFMHVAEFTGADPVYYRSRAVQRFYEWLYAFTLNPFNQIITFGDAGFGRYFETLTPPSSAFAATNFSERAGALAAYRMTLPHHPEIPGDLLSYCITRKPLPAPLPPRSEFWRDGGAVFWEKEKTTDALMGALYNVSQDAGHMHKEANAVYLAGYGETLLANAGYNGYGNGFGGFDFNYIRNNAASGNTLTISGRNHVSVKGDGIEEGIIDDHFQYVSSLADQALEGPAAHRRNFFFIPPQEGENGYFAVLDEVEHAGASQPITVHWHPMAAQAEVRRPDQQFTWTIRRQKQTPTFLTVFLGTPVTGATLKKGLLAGWKDSFVGEYLQADYRSTAGGSGQIVSVLFPHDAAHPLANLTQLSGDGYTGARVAFADRREDLIVESQSDEPKTVSDIRFQGKGLLFRQQGRQTLFYFVRKGKTFLSANRELGFTADKPISVFLKNGQGRLISPGAEVTFYQTGLNRVEVDGQPLTIRQKGKGRVTVFLPAGDHRIRLR